MGGDFVVKTQEFEGPLDTLLSLIRSRELYINDISLAKVTDDYIQYINENRESLENMAEFVRIAATLVLAKSQSLLPEEAADDKQQQEVDDLEDRLRAYRMIQDRARAFRDQFGAQPAFSRSATKQELPDLFAPGNTLTAEKLRDDIEKCVVDLPQDSLPTEEITDTLPLKEELLRIQEYCKDHKHISFSQIVRSQKKHHQVVSFVAVLELHHQGKIAVSQPANFEDIVIRQP